MSSNEEKALIESFSALVANATNAGYTETKIGFEPPLDHVGTINRRFSFKSDPWNVVSAGGVILCRFTNIVLNAAKVFNPNNTTASYLTISWNAEYFYREDYDLPQVNLKLMADDGATLSSLFLGYLPVKCGSNPELQSLQKDFEATYFDRIVASVYTIAPSMWKRC